MPAVVKTVFITGGSRGIGRAITLKLIEEGFKRIIIGYLQNDEEAEKTLKWVEEHNAIVTDTINCPTIYVATR